MSEPIKSAKGATDIGPRDPTRDAENPDVFVPPSTDKGLVPNLRFSFADAHMNRQDGGWSREVTQRELPIATEMAGVNMRLKTGGVRELTGTSRPNGRSCWGAMRALPPSTMMAKTLSQTSQQAISGTFPPGSRIRSRVWVLMAASFCWHFRMARSPKAAPSF